MQPPRWPSRCAAPRAESPRLPGRMSAASRDDGPGACRRWSLADRCPPLWDESGERDPTRRTRSHGSARRLAHRAIRIREKPDWSSLAVLCARQPSRARRPFVPGETGAMTLPRIPPQRRGFSHDDQRRGRSHPARSATGPGSGRRARRQLASFPGGRPGLLLLGEADGPGGHATCARPGSSHGTAVLRSSLPGIAFSTGCGWRSRLRYPGRADRGVSARRSLSACVQGCDHAGHRPSRRTGDRTTR
jgi:hypothetical protein